MSLLGAAAAAAAAPAHAGCPEGYYSTSAITFACGGDVGLAHVVVPPEATLDVVNISKGVRYFRVAAASKELVALRLYDRARKEYVLAGHGGDDERSRSGTYQGLGVVFSKNLVSSPPQEHLYLLGTLPRSLVLRFSNRERTPASVAMNFSYDGVDSCPHIPDGCAALDNETAAQADVLGRSHSAAAAASDDDPFATLKPARMWRYLEGAAVLLGVLAVGTAIWAICRYSRGSRRGKRTRAMAAFEKDDALPTLSDLQEAKTQLVDRGVSAAFLPFAPGEGSADSTPVPTNSSSLGSSSRSGGCGSGPLGGFLGPGAGWGSLWPSRFGMGWPPAPSQGSFRYGPLPLAEEQYHAGCAPYGLGPSKGLLPGSASPTGSTRSFSSSLPRAAQSFASAAPCSRSMLGPLAAGLPQEPLTGSALPSPVTSVAAPALPPARIHVQERSLSFSNAVIEETGQTVPAVTTVQRSYSFTRAQNPPPLPTPSDRAPREQVEVVRAALQKQAPWAAVFTPEEWAKTSQLMQNGQQRQHFAGVAPQPGGPAPVTLLQLQP